jgi:hypothetical protein
MPNHDNLINDYAQQADELEALAASCTIESATWRPGAGGWSFVEVAGHLADAELLAAVRLRRVITQDQPNFYAYQQERWAQRLHYQYRELARVVARFVLLRGENADLLKELTREDWRRKGRHDQDGVLSLRQLIEGYISHTAKHLQQMQATVRAFTEQQD